MAGPSGLGLLRPRAGGSRARPGPDRGAARGGARRRRGLPGLRHPAGRAADDQGRPRLAGGFPQGLRPAQGARDRAPGRPRDRHRAGPGSRSTTPAGRTRCGWREGGPARSWRSGAARSTSKPPACTARWSTFISPAKARGCCFRSSSPQPSTNSTRPARPSRAGSAMQARACCRARWPMTATSPRPTRPMPCGTTCWPTSTGGCPTPGSPEPRSRPRTACRRAPSTGSSAASPGR